jgi:hypothetical protein
LILCGLGLTGGEKGDGQDQQCPDEKATKKKP